MTSKYNITLNYIWPWFLSSGDHTAHSNSSKHLR